MLKQHMVTSNCSLQRAPIVDAQFIECVQQQQFPITKSYTTQQQAALNHHQIFSIFKSQITSRHLDIIARELKEQNKSFYTIGSSGHEGNAAIAAAFEHTDMAFLHYRSAAFVLQRAQQHVESNIDMAFDILLSLVTATDDPIASGRHKVFGSKPLFIPPQTSTIASHLPKSVGTALSIIRAKELDLATAVLPSDSVIICSFGDASFNHASAQSALNSAEWISSQAYPLPIVFVCEDNGIGISMPTPKTWIEQRMANNQYINYLQCDGLNICDTYQKATLAATIARQKHQPVFLHMKCVRLMGHAGSDIESQYLSQEQISANEFNDPLLHSARILIESGIASSADIIDIYQQIRDEIAGKAKVACQCESLADKNAVMASIIPPNSGQTVKLKSLHTASKTDVVSRNLSQNINLALHDLMAEYPNLIILGEDIGKKGGVYRVTANLQKQFGQRRVFDTLLDETTILGTAIGMAHNGFIPMPEIQFLAYYHNAEDQIRGEAATLSFFSNQQFQNPMVIRIAGLAYQKGFGGHFHNDNSIAALRDIPGVIIACPSNGADAAKMLRQCVALAATQGRVVFFLEPIALYMTKDLHKPGDGSWLKQYPAVDEQLGLGEIGLVGDSNDTDCAIVSFANGFYLSLQAQKVLAEQHAKNISVIDLRWLNPLPEQQLIEQLADFDKILIVDETRKTGSVSEALMTLFMESFGSSKKLKRVTAEDCFIPLGNAWQYVLPSRDGIVNAVLELLT